MIWYCSPNIFRVIKWRMRCAEHVVCKGEWRKLHNEKLNDLYSLNIVRVIKLSKMKWAGHVAHTGERRGVHRWGNLTEGDRLEDAGIDRRIILRWIFRKWGVGAWNGSS